MKFVETHLTTHHLLRAPHKWFFAFLASPIHFAEMHYKNRYHLQFSHAKKLFLFDMSLIATLAVVGAAFLGWSMYNPTVTDLVYVSITPSKDRILSGEYVGYTIEYSNKSTVRLTDAVLSLELPEGYVVDASAPEEKFNTESQEFKLGGIAPGEKGSVGVSGWFYGTPNVEDHIHAKITYRQDGKTRDEEKTSPHIIFLRGSLLTSAVELQEQIVEGSRVPVKITLTNTGDETLHDISFSFDPLRAIGVLENMSATIGSATEHMWSISELAPNTSGEFTGVVHVSDSLSASVYPLELAPALTVRGKTIAQSLIKKDMTIAHPRVQVQAQWDAGVASLKPGETGRLSVVITNTGNVELSDGVVEIPLPKGTVNVSEAARANAGSISQSTLIMTGAKHVGLKSIPVGESRTLAVLLPVISTSDAGTNVVLQPTVRFKGNVAIAREVKVEDVSVAASVKVGTDLSLSGEVRYYTAEGDQLGRGPLPPEVGKETKYAALFTIRNTTSNVTNGVFTARLAPGIEWTGKTSVTQGSAPSYTPSTRTVRWSMGTIPAHANAGLFFELSLTPTEADRGTVPDMITGAEVTGSDSYLGYSLVRTSGLLDSSLKTDTKGSAKGSAVR
ncbi:MAG TPA: hypothetical protein PK295_01500 [Candidatus Magasanikbacteria bacterium]|nr:hypothetical protein [Candidatus Magasanikbacteria bacterium]